MRWEYRTEKLWGPLSASPSLNDMARRLEAALNPNAPEIPTPVGADVRLNVFGNEGWELVTILADDDGERVAILKREKR